MAINRNPTIPYHKTLLAMRAARDSGDLYDVMKATRKNIVSDTRDLGAKARKFRTEAEEKNAELSQMLFDQFKVASASGEELMQAISQAKTKNDLNSVSEAKNLKKPVKISSESKTAIGSRLMTELQEVFGITKAQAAGIVGNLDYETGGFKYLQELEPVVPGSKGGRGFAMWTGPRREAFESWSKENNLDPDSYEASFGFLVHEVQNTNEGRFIKDLEKTTTAEEAARVFSNQYLRPGKPNINQRISASNTYYAMGDN